MSSDLSHALEVASELARRAGDATLSFFQDPALAVDRKGDPTVGEPVTAADRASEAIILEGLRRAFPDDGILSEEQADTDSWARHPRAWALAAGLMLSLPLLLYRGEVVAAFGTVAAALF